MPLTLFLVCLASTTFLTGLIWFVQVVHYPLFEAVPAADFERYHAAHVRLTTRVVAAPMLLELASSAALVVFRPTWLPAWITWAGLAASAGCMILTATVQVPLHNRLARGFHVGAARRLIATNWARTWLWTAHAGLLFVALASLAKLG